MEKLSKEPSPENLEAEIERLWQEIESHNDLYDFLDMEAQEEALVIHNQRTAGKNREELKSRMEKFLEFLREERKRIDSQKK